MRKRVGLAITILLVLVAGCGISMKSATWTKPGISTAQGEKDMAECSEKANLLNLYGDKYDDGVFYVWGSVWGSDPVKPGIIFQKCMEGKGYNKAQ